MKQARSTIRMYQDSVFHVKGRVKLGPGVGVVTGPNAKLTIGDNTYITASSVVYCAREIEIGRDCAIAWGTSIMDTDFHHIYYADGTQNELTSPVRIGDKVWIGCNTTILKGVTIGDNAVIGANTLVNRDVPPNCLAAGNPMHYSGRDRLASLNCTNKPGRFCRLACNKKRLPAGLGYTGRQRAPALSQVMLLFTLQ